MIDFASVKSFIIPEGEVQSISKDGVAVWTKQNETQNPYSRELEYIESTGTQWIDTLWKASVSTPTLQIGFMLTETLNTNAICGSEDLESDCRFLFRLCGTKDGESRMAFSCGYGANNGAAYFTLTIGKLYKYVWTMSGTKNTLKPVGGSGKSITFKDYPIDCTAHPKTLNIFQCTGTDRSCVKLYYLKITESGTLVRDFIPVMDNNNVPCLFDKVEGKLYYNQGEGEFLYGEISS